MRSYDSAIFAILANAVALLSYTVTAQTDPSLANNICSMCIAQGNKFCSDGNCTDSNY